MLFDQFATMQQGAIHGLGIALLPTFLIADELAAGRLIPVWGGPTPSIGSYWLVWPKDGAMRPAMAAFRDWIGSEIA
jgi:DNA-binding transcriptional LysR family regulator